MAVAPAGMPSMRLSPYPSFTAIKSYVPAVKPDRVKAQLPLVVAENPVPSANTLADRTAVAHVLVESFTVPVMVLAPDATEVNWNGVVPVWGMGCGFCDSSGA